MSYLSIESTVRHRSVGICYLLDKCIHALIDDIYIDTSFRKKCAHNSHTYKIQLNELKLCVEWSVIWYIYMRSNRIYFFGTKTLEKKQFSFEEEKKQWVSEWMLVCVMEKKGRPLRSSNILFKECPSLVFITIELYVMTKFNDVDIVIYMMVVNWHTL